MMTAKSKLIAGAILVLLLLVGGVKPVITDGA
jgi:hypothetical protein